ncbi:MAG: alpha/beta fold hydrolase [Planctomycetota bacterium]|nr:alpha/beta fold hydrolase [Planctomycetota bacterium]
MLNGWAGLLKFLKARWLWLYVALLVFSNVVAWRRLPTAPQTPPGAQRFELALPRMTDAGPLAGRHEPYRMSVVSWKAAQAPPLDSVLARAWTSVRDRLGAGPGPRPPIILLHGCPSGGGADFETFAPLLAAAGYDVYAPDLPSSGASGRDAPSYSVAASGRLVLAAMQQLGIPRAHVLGWSQGGGAGLVMASLAPDKVASLTLLASIGTQETEGSGSYFFEHFKYRVGHTLLVALPEVLPHFGLLGSRATRWTLLRPFLDSDLRPMRSLMESLRTPTLILHGRHDFLVPAWGAEEHARRIVPSSLVMLDADHFIPLGPPMGKLEALTDGAAHTLAFIAQHDEPGGPLVRSAAILCPPEAHITKKLGGVEITHGTPWWAIIGLIFAATMVSEDLTTITVGLLIASQSIDWGVGLLGCLIAIFLGDLSLWLLGRILGRRVLSLPFIRGAITEKSLVKWGEVLDKHTGKAVMLSRFLPGTRLPTFVAAGILSRRSHIFFMWVALAAFLWTPFLLAITIIVGPSVLEVFKSVFHGPWAIVAAIIVMFLVLRLVGYETTEMGRDRLKADLRRFITPEFWPAWIFYLPFVPGFLWMALRRGLMTFSCANPGVPAGGGLIGESKSELLQGLERGGARDHVLPHILVRGGVPAEERAARALAAVAGTPELGGYPVILKPDQGFRGYGVKLARNEDDVIEYFRVMTRDVIVQRYHPGPGELGVLWARVPRDQGPVDSWPGEVFSATGKDFPFVTGDGKHTLELLIWNHPRLRMQADVFTTRMSDRLDSVPAAGERVSLGIAGNHCQGTKFYDAMPAITPALAERIDAIARSYRGAGGGALDFGRFDLRFTSPEELARGAGFAIVELNGTSSESTSMYDPAKSVWWTYGLLYRHWARLFRIGAARRRQGARPMSLGALVAAWRAHRRNRPGPLVSD